MNYSVELKSRIYDALKAKGAEYKPRTHHMHEGLPIYTNRLIFEDSPYLLQHAHNPVNWYPWGEEAFDTARMENKPVFLSIGYATCHWCHVMEEESFESVKIAEALNENFIAIKVDREQYPDIDQAYMTAVQMITGQGGWPMSSFLTHEGKPFFGGTYYPSTSFIHLLLQIKQAWDNQHQELIAQADQIAEAVHNMTASQEQLSNLELSAVQSAIDAIISQYDPVDGGFNQAPKFPNEPLLLLLLHSLERRSNPKVLSALNHTLSAMARGGLYDQIGGGFHRYSTDTKWLVPHFEKMLYNQAYLARVYCKAYRLTGYPFYLRVVRQTLDYVLREMTTGSGVFYSATDADSEGHEGTFFIWDEDELKNLFSNEDAEFLIKLFGATQRGNFEGKNILYLPFSLDEVSDQQGVSINELFDRIDPLLGTLRTYREKRIPPLTDNKVIVAWNGMLITALAEAGDILGEQRYIKAAETAADALWKTQRSEEGNLWRVSLDGKASIPARQEDYAHFIEGLLALYDAANDHDRLQQARSLSQEMLDKFSDSSSGALIMGEEKLLFTQPKDAHDGALPSGNAVAVRVLSRIARRTGDSKFSDHANKILHAFSGNISQHPVAYAYMLAQLDEIQNGETETQQYAARGAIKINCKLTHQRNRKLLTVELNIAEGWHVNAHKPAQEGLTATKINNEENNHWSLDSITYPKPKSVSLKFEKDPMQLYLGQIQILSTLLPESNNADYPIHLKLQIQACNQELCLPPEIINLTVYDNARH